MTQTSWPFDSQTSTENDWSRLLRYLTMNPAGGVIGVPGGTDVQPYADSTGMQVKIRVGSAIVRGHAYLTDAVVTLAVGAAGANPRIDAIVLELDPTANVILPKIVAGTPAVSPVAPTLTQTDTGVYQLLIGTVSVPASSSTVSAGQVTDYRPFIGANAGKWTTATRPAIAYSIGVNATTGLVEFTLDGTTWKSLPSAGDPVTASQISAAEQANIVAGEVRSGGAVGGSIVAIHVGSTTPTAVAGAVNLWFN